MKGGNNLILLLLLFFFSYSSRATMIPRRYDGFVFSAGGSIVVEAFLDPVCPDSRDSWDPLVRMVQNYSPHVSLIVHPFPLPYHANSFLSCRALHIVNELNESATFSLLELFFKYQTKFYNDQTVDILRADVIKLMSDIAEEVIGSSSRPAFKDGFNEPNTDTASRISFKYGCSRGVTGTPHFLVNGFALPGSGSALDYNEWKHIIDPLLQDVDG